MSQHRGELLASASRDGGDRRYDGRSDRSTSDGSFAGHAPVQSAPVLSLVKAIEGEVIPRLMLARRAEPAPAPVPRDLTARPVSSDDVTEFTRLLLRGSPDVVSRFVEAMRAEGVTLQTLYLELVTPAARLLGAYWDADKCDFVAVTVGLGRLQKVLRDLGGDFRSENGQEDRGLDRRAILSAAPGEQHLLGPIMVAEFFRRAGWIVLGGPLWTSQDHLALVSANWIDMFGLSVTNADCLEATAAAIPSIRRASRNPGVQILLGGRIFVENPDLAIRLGANGTASDGNQAALLANDLVSRVSVR
jgi:methanogenic corrinoid protein MtbC1